MSPVLQEPRRLRRDAPILRIGNTPPFIDLLANAIDDGGMRVLLRLCGQLRFSEQERRLIPRSLLLSRLRNGRDELRRPSLGDDPLRRLARFIELPMP